MTLIALTAKINSS